jgi:RNA polymerase sigma-70 factor, ECF subfamily
MDSGRECARAALEGLDEGTIVARAQDGDAEAFEYLVDAYQQKLFRLACRLLGDRAQAEDVVQETLVAMWRKLPLLASPGAFGGWLYHVATNRCLDILRKRSTHPEEPTEAEELQRCADARPDTRTPASRTLRGDPAYEAEMSAQLHDLASALETLSPDLRATWLLREMHGHSYTEIAAILKITEPTVRGRLARARQHLAERMNPWR